MVVAHEQISQTPCTRAEKLQAALARKQALEGAAGPTSADPRFAGGWSSDVGASASCLADLGLAGSPQGNFASAISPSHESLRDFGRIVVSSERRLFIMTRGMVSMRPLHIASESLGLDAPKTGNLSTKDLERVCTELQEALSQRLSAACCLPLDEASLVLLQQNVVRSMSANVGIDFTVRTGLVPTFLQPLYVLVFMGGAAGGTAMQAHLLVYGFVAGRMDHISNDPDVKCTPFCACLMSPNLLDSTLSCEDGACRVWEYSVRRVSTCSIREAAERDAQLLRHAVKLGRLDFQSDCAGNLRLSGVEKDIKSIGSTGYTRSSDEAVACERVVNLQSHSEAVEKKAKVPTRQPAKAKQSSRDRTASSPATTSGPSQKAPTSILSSLWSPASWSQSQRGLSRAFGIAGGGPLHELSPQLAAIPSGHFITTRDVGGEAHRNFARVFLAKGHQRRVYVMARGMVSMRPLQLAGGADIGDLDNEMINHAQKLFTDALAQWIEVLGAPQSLMANRDGLCAAVAAAMSGSVGIEFSQHAGLLPMFMQPMFVLLILAGHADTQPQVRMLVYGFVAGSLDQVGTGRTETKSTPFCARLTSPDLLALGVGTAGDACEWEYTVYRVQSTSIREAAERDAARLREAVGCGKW